MLIHSSREIGPWHGGSGTECPVRVDIGSTRSESKKLISFTFFREVKDDMKI